MRVARAPLRAISPDGGIGPVPAPAGLGDKALYMAWRGTDDDSSLWWTTFDGVGWAPQQKIPGTASRSRPALALFNDTVFATWRGQPKDEALYSSMFARGTWALQLKIPASAAQWDQSS